MVFYQYPDERQVLETWLRDPARNGGADAFGAFLDKWVERDDEIHDTEGLSSSVHKQHEAFREFCIDLVCNAIAPENDFYSVDQKKRIARLALQATDTRQAQRGAEDCNCGVKDLAQALANLTGRNVVVVNRNGNQSVYSSQQSESSQGSSNSSM